MQIYFVLFTVVLSVYTTYSMDQSFKIQTYSCNNFQQAYFLVDDEARVMLNTKGQCNIVDLGANSAKILFEHDNNEPYYLVAHPQKPLIALSNTKEIVICNYVKGEHKSFKTDNCPGLVSIGKFNPCSSTFYYDTGYGLFCLNYESPDGFTHKLDISRNSSTWGMNRPLDYNVAFEQQKNAICVITDKSCITVCNEDDILAGKFLEGRSTYRLELNKVHFIRYAAHRKRPFFWEYALQGALLIYAVQNYGYCKEIILINTSNATEKKILALNGTDFVQMVLHPNGMILATLSLPGMLLQWWNIKTGQSLSESIPLVKKNDTPARFRHFYEFFMSYSPRGKKIVIGETNGNEYKIVESPDKIITQLYKSIMPSYPLGFLVLQKKVQFKELKNLIIEKLLELYRSQVK